MIFESLAKLPFSDFAAKFGNGKNPETLRHQYNAMRAEAGLPAEPEQAAAGCSGGRCNGGGAAAQLVSPQLSLNGGCSGPSCGSGSGSGAGADGWLPEWLRAAFEGRQRASGSSAHAAGQHPGALQGPAPTPAATRA